MQIYNEKEQTVKGKTHNVQFEEKRGIRNWNGAKACTQGNKHIKEKPNVKWKKGDGNFIFSSCKKELKKGM